MAHDPTTELIPSVNGSLTSPTPTPTPTPSSSPAPVESDAGLDAGLLPGVSETDRLRATVLKLAEMFESDAKQVPLGTTFHGGPLDGASIYNVDKRTAVKLRELARSPEALASLAAQIAIELVSMKSDVDEL